jgi:hypothetical protein
MDTAQREFCLDLMKVSWADIQGCRQSDCAILLEIEPLGGLIQTTVPISCGSEITLNSGLGPVKGQVTSCEQDPYGYVVNFTILAKAMDWYPEYVPPFMHSAGGR